ncbi:MAG: hypothetical protein IJ343_13720 [Clostridia bacterium]|nr:hypothetical protein [Clostridia bacterium]
MPETLTAFHARVDGFTADSLPHEGGLVTRDSLTAKVGWDGGLRPFFGNTMIYELDDASKLALCQRQVLLHHRAGWCLAEPLAPETFHITLHDLINSPEEAAIAADVTRTEAQALTLLEELRREGIPPIRMVSTHVFSMVNTSLVMGFAPETEADCIALMGLYERLHAVVPIAWGLTPHATLAYYKPGAYGPETMDALNAAIHEAKRLPPIRLLLEPDRLFHRRFSDMNHYF